MTIRKCESRDIPSVLNLAVSMMQHMKQQPGITQFAEDDNVLVGGIIETLIFWMMYDKHILLVMPDARGRITGFLGGRVETYPAYYAHKQVGAILSVYPFAATAKPLVDAFDQWAKANGCTSRTAYMLSSFDLGTDFMKEIGMESKAVIYSIGY